MSDIYVLNSLLDCINQDAIDTLHLVDDMLDELSPESEGYMDLYRLWKRLSLIVSLSTADEWLINEAKLAEQELNEMRKVIHLDF